MFSVKLFINIRKYAFFIVLKIRKSNRPNMSIYFIV